jgi:Glyoxalase superfamily protein
MIVYTVVDDAVAARTPSVSPRTCGATDAGFAGSANRVLVMSAVAATAILSADDAIDSAGWYRLLGFEIEFMHRFSDHSPLFVGIGSGHAKLLLSEHRGDAPPNGLVYVRVDDLDAAAAAVGVSAEMQEWGIREAHALDPGGNRVRIAQFEGDLTARH